MKNVFIHSRRLETLPYPPSCPFNTSRAGRARKILDSMGLLEGADREVAEPQQAGRELLEKFHTPEYLDALNRAQGGSLEPDMLYMGLGSGDCPIFAGMYEYSALAAGATVLGAGLIIEGSTGVAFNPSGGLHHAHAAMAAGFCYINDVVLGCMTLAEAGRRVLYLDIDVHHGDGVQDAFYDRNDVITISMHQDGRTLFPGSGFVDEIGVGAGRGYSINIPLPPGTYDQIYLYAFDQIVPVLAAAYKPDVIVMEIGADTLAGDPLASLCLTNNVIADIVRRVRQLGKPVLATGGGGYNIENTVRAWCLAWAVLCGDDRSGQDEFAGMGGVMLGSTDWRGGAGLHDRVLVVDKHRRQQVDTEIERTLERLKKLVFPIHGI